MQNEQRKRQLADSYIRLETKIEDLSYDLDEAESHLQEVADDFGREFPCESMTEAVQAARVRRIKVLSDELRELQNQIA